MALFSNIPFVRICTREKMEKLINEKITKLDNFVR